MKKLFSLLAILCLVFVLAACSGSEKTEKKDEGKKGKSDEEKTEQATISYSNWSVGTEEEMNLERLLIQQLQRDYPNIKVEIKEITGDWNEQLAVAASANNMPDVFALTNM